MPENSHKYPLIFKHFQIKDRTRLNLNLKMEKLNEISSGKYFNHYIYKNTIAIAIFLKSVQISMESNFVCNPS